jgi:hypothetical protein
MNNNLVVESWRDVPEYEGHYKVSSLGRFWGLRSKRVIQTCNGKVVLSKRGIPKPARVSEILERAFPESLLYVVIPTELGLEYRRFELEKAAASPFKAA